MSGNQHFVTKHFVKKQDLVYKVRLLVLSINFFVDYNSKKALLEFEIVHQNGRSEAGITCPYNVSHLGFLNIVSCDNNC